MQFYWPILGVLAVWRVTHLLHAEAGPWDVFERARRRLSEGFWASLTSCFLCLSLWVSIPFALLIGGGWQERGLLWLALSGGAILLERVTGREKAAPAAQWFEEEEERDVRMQEDEHHDRIPGGAAAGGPERVH